MAGNASQNGIEGRVGGRSFEVGDLPEHLLRRYYLDNRGGQGVGIYSDARVKAARFRDQGRLLTAARTDPSAIGDMIAVAQHRGWTSVKVQGSPTFRREAWLAGIGAGLEVSGYQPTERDRQEVEKKRARGQHKFEERDEPPNKKRPRGAPKGVLAQTPSMRIVETVVRSRVASRSAQDRILANARDRLATWLEQGARLAPISVRHPPGYDRFQSKGRARER